MLQRGIPAIKQALAPIRTSVVILTYARDPVVTEVLDALRPMIGARTDCEVVLVDNNADAIDRTAMLAGFANSRLVRMPTNVGVIARNDGVAAAVGETIVLLDDDVFVRTPDFPDRFARLFDEDPQLGVVTIRKLTGDAEGSRVDLIPHTDKSVDLTRPFKTFRFVGGCVAFRRTMFQDLGGFSREFFYGLEEIEFSYRIVEAGWTILYTPEVEAFELEHPAGRRPMREVQTARLKNKYIMSWLHMPFPHIVLNYALFTPYIAWRTRGEISIGGAVGGFMTWLGRKDRPRRRPIGQAARAYIVSTGGSLWR